VDQNLTLGREAADRAIPLTFLPPGKLGTFITTISARDVLLDALQSEVMPRERDQDRDIISSDFVASLRQHPMVASAIYLAVRHLHAAGQAQKLLLSVRGYQLLSTRTSTTTTTTSDVASLPAASNTGVSVPSQMLLDQAAIESLGVCGRGPQGQRGTLYGRMCRALSGPGRRLVRKWLLEPSLDLAAIENNLDAVEAFRNSTTARETFRKRVLEVAVDLEHEVPQVVFQLANFVRRTGDPAGTGIPVTPTRGGHLRDLPIDPASQAPGGTQPLPQPQQQQQHVSVLNALGLDPEDLAEYDPVVSLNLHRTETALKEAHACVQGLRSAHLAIDAVSGMEGAHFQAARMAMVAAEGPLQELEALLEHMGCPAPPPGSGSGSGAPSGSFRGKSHGPRGKQGAAPHTKASLSTAYHVQTDLLAPGVCDLVDVAAARLNMAQYHLTRAFDQALQDLRALLPTSKHHLVGRVERGDVDGLLGVPQALLEILPFAEDPEPISMDSDADTDMDGRWEHLDGFAHGGRGMGPHRRRHQNQNQNQNQKRPRLNGGVRAMVTAASCVRSLPKTAGPFVLRRETRTKAWLAHAAVESAQDHLDRTREDHLRAVQDFIGAELGTRFMCPLYAWRSLIDAFATLDALAGFAEATVFVLPTPREAQEESTHRHGLDPYRGSGSGSGSYPNLDPVANLGSGSGSKLGVELKSHNPAIQVVPSTYRPLSVNPAPAPVPTPFPFCRPVLLPMSLEESPVTHLRQAWLPTLLDSASSSLSSTPWSSRGDDSRTGGAPTGGPRVVPNDIDLGGGVDVGTGRRRANPADNTLHDGASLPRDGGRVVILTGSNMGGKTTLLRCVGTVQILAQAGCFVPCTSATLTLCDQIWTRMGARDELSSGLSTFQLEAIETASCLHHATRHSLLLFDELGRGTSTHDGYAILYAVLRHTAHVLGARAFFATHFHQLNREMELRNDPILAFRHMRVVVERGSGIATGTDHAGTENGTGTGAPRLWPTFSLRPGPGTATSCGLLVATSAGVPVPVAARAQIMSARLEHHAATGEGHLGRDPGQRPRAKVAPRKRGRPNSHELDQDGAEYEEFLDLGVDLDANLDLDLDRISRLARRLIRTVGGLSATRGRRVGSSLDRGLVPYPAPASCAHLLSSPSPSLSPEKREFVPRDLSAAYLELKACWRHVQRG
jgi:hypothetical protein